MPYCQHRHNRNFAVSHCRDFHLYPLSAGEGKLKKIRWKKTRLGAWFDYLTSSRFI